MPDPPERQPVIVHLIDGTYELFRHFYGSMRGRRPKDPQFAAVRGVLGTVLGMIEGDATHIGVATDHVIESFRNDLWPGYKTGDGVDPALKAQFHPLEQALAAMGVAVWPMVELEADDGLASAARIAAADDRVEQVCIWPIEAFPDNVLGQDRDRALLFKHLATLKTDAPLFQRVEELRWLGPADGFAAWEGRVGDKRLSERVLAASREVGQRLA